MPKKNRQRKTIDYDPEIDRALKKIAKEYGVPLSQLYILFAAEGALNVFGEEDDKTSFWSRLKPSKSRGYKHNIDVEELKRRLKDYLDE